MDPTEVDSFAQQAPPEAVQQQPDPLSAMEPAKPDPLAGIPSREAMSVSDDEAIARRSSLYAYGTLADQPSEGGEDLNQLYASTKATIRDTMSLMGDESYRQQAEIKALQSSVKTLSSMAQNAADPMAADASRAALARTLEEKAQQTAKEEAERAWAESVTAMRDNGDDIEAELEIMQHDTPDVFDNLIDIQTVRADIMREMEEAGSHARDRNWLFAITDALMYMVPFSQSNVHEGTFEPTPDHMKKAYDFIFSGEIFHNETNSAWKSLLAARTPDERKKIISTVRAGIDKQVSTMFGPNELMRLQLWHEYNVTPSVLERNIYDAMDNVPFIVGGAYKAFKVPFQTTNVLKGFGASGKAADAVTKAAAILKAEGPEAALAKMGMKPDEIIDGVLPSALDPKQAAPLSKAKVVTDEERNMLRDLFNQADEGQFDDDIASGITKTADEAIPDPKTTPGVVVDNLTRGEELFKEWVGELQVIERLNDAEKAAAEADLIKRAEKLAINPKEKRTVVDVQWNTKTLPTGSELHTVWMTLGAAKKAGRSGWYKTAELARTKLLTRSGIQDGEVIKIADEQYGVRLRLPLDETGRALGGARMFMPLEDKLQSGVFSGVARWLASGKTLASDELFGSGALSLDKRDKLNKVIRDTILPVFHKMNKEDKEFLGAVLAKGETNSVWYTPDELRVFYAVANGTEADASKFVAGYQASKDINDVRYYLHNMAELTGLHSQGYETVFFSGLDAAGNGKVIRHMTGVPSEVIWDVENSIARVGKETGKAAYDKNRLTLTDLEHRQAKGYVLVRMQEVQKMPDGSRARFFLVPGNQLQLSPLEPMQIPYKAGGARMYTGKYFPKKAVVGEQPWGEAFLDKPFTPTVALTRAEGLQWVDDMNMLQDAYVIGKKAKKSDAQLIKIVEAEMDKLTSNMGKPPPEEFVEWMKKYGSVHKFELVYDRELPSAYAGARGAGMTSWEEPASGINSYMETQGRMFTSSKGPVLRNIQNWELQSETLDPFTTMNSALTQIARMSSLTDFKIKGTQKWITTYGPALDLRGVEGLSPMRIFLESKFKTGTKDLQLIKGAAEIQRDFIKRTLGWKSDFDLSVEAGTRKFIEMVAGDKIGLRSKLTHGAYNWWEENNIINAIQGVSFDATMGALNPAQFPLQVQTMFAATSIDTSKGMQAMANLPALWLYFRKAGKDADLDFFVSKGWHKMAGYENPEDYINMMKALKRTGYMDNMLGAMTEQFGPKSAMGVVGKTVDDARKGGRFFVNEAERWNKFVAWNIAWRRVAEQFPNMKTASPAFVAKTRSVAETFAASMSEASAAAWQKNGFTKVPTQFMSYMARWHEMLINKDLTVPERLRFVVGQYMFYGTAGIPFAAWWFAEQEKISGTTPKIGTLEGTLDRGLIDTMLFYATGADLAFSERAGIGMYPTDIIMEIMGHGRYGETSAADILFGASGQIVGQAADAGFEAVKYAMAETGGETGMPLTVMSIKRAARSISTLNNIFKAEAIWNYGQYTNRKGEVILDDMPSMYGFAALLGIPPAEFQKQTAEMGWMEKRKEKVDQWTEQVIIFRQQLGNAMRDGDYDKAREVSQDVNFVMKHLIPKDIKTEVLKKAFADPRTRTVAESIAERYEKEQNQKEFLERNKRGESN